MWPPVGSVPVCGEPAGCSRLGTSPAMELPV